MGPQWVSTFYLAPKNQFHLQEEQGFLKQEQS
jgi:hypothetical protein